MDDLASYIMNERKTLASESRDFQKVTIKNLFLLLKGRKIFATKEWAQQKRNKKIILQIVDHMSNLKYKLTYEDDFTMVVRVANRKRFKKDFLVSFETMSLWIAIVGGDFLKGKLACKNKNKEAPAKLET